MFFFSLVPYVDPSSVGRKGQPERCPNGLRAVLRKGGDMQGWMWEKAVILPLCFRKLDFSCLLHLTQAIFI